MGKTSAAVKYRYNQKAYDRIAVFVPKGRKADVEACARSQSVSVNGFINGLLAEALGLDTDTWHSRGDDPSAEGQKRD